MKTLILTFSLILRSMIGFAVGSSSSPLPTEREIYEFMKMVIKDQKLNPKLYLDTVPSTYCSTSDDSTFLYTLLIHPDTVQKSKKSTGVFNPFNGQTYTISSLNTCLNIEDIKTMLYQRSRLSAFKWDRKKLDFSKTPTYEYYNISVPLFSKDRNIAILMIEQLCPGLCGMGYTVIYKRKNNTWTYENSGTWYH